MELPVPRLPVDTSVAVIHENDKPPAPFMTASAYLRAPDRVDSALIKSIMTGIRRQCGDEAKQIMVKVLDPINTSPGKDESGFSEIIPITFTVYYAPKRMFNRTTNNMPGCSKEPWMPRDEWLAKRRREEELNN